LFCSQFWTSVSAVQRFFQKSPIPITGVVLSDQVKLLDWKARNIKVIKHYDPNDAQIKEIDEIIDECLAKIATYLT